MSKENTASRQKITIRYSNGKVVGVDCAGKRLNKRAKDWLSTMTISPGGLGVSFADIATIEFWEDTETHPSFAEWLTTSIGRPIFMHLNENELLGGEPIECPYIKETRLD